MGQHSLIDRAFIAYRREGGSAQPSNESDIQRHRSKTYAVLRNCNGVLAVYCVDRVKDRLKRLDKWPKAIEAY